MLQMPAKDPTEVLDYSIDWSPALDGDSILSSTWTVESGGVNVQSSSVSGTTTVAWMAGGVANTPAIVKNTITTQGGRTYVERLKILVTSQ